MVVLEHSKGAETRGMTLDQRSGRSCVRPDGGKKAGMELFLNAPKARRIGIEFAQAPSAVRFLKWPANVL
jgi:hypothetical protein